MREQRAQAVARERIFASQGPALSAVLRQSLPIIRRLKTGIGDQAFASIEKPPRIIRFRSRHAPRAVLSRGEEEEASSVIWIAREGRPLGCRDIVWRSSRSSAAVLDPKCAAERCDLPVVFGSVLPRWQAEPSKLLVRFASRFQQLIWCRAPSAWTNLSGAAPAAEAGGVFPMDSRSAGGSRGDSFRGRSGRMVNAD